VDTVALVEILSVKVRIGIIAFVHAFYQDSTVCVFIRSTSVRFFVYFAIFQLIAILIISLRIPLKYISSIACMFDFLY
jgi:hypothetical protein